MASSSLLQLGSTLLPALKKGNSATDNVIYTSSGKPKVYMRRWFILAAFSLGYFTWNLHATRQIPLVPEFALFFNTTNEFNIGEGKLGVDFISALDGFLLIFLYPLSGYLVDRFGLIIMVLGSILQALGAWWMFAADDNFSSLLASRVLVSLAGTMIATSFLRVTNGWFPNSERPYAVAIGVIMSELGAGSSLLVGPAFHTGDLESNPDLLSCQANNFDSLLLNNVTCEKVEQDNFCCATETNIYQLNLVMGILATCVALYTMIVTRDAPPSPPSKAAITKKSPSFWKGTKLMFSKRNYSQICLADFIMSGPPQVLFATLSRVFPSEVQESSFLVGAAGLALAIPTACIFGYYLSKNKKYFEMTAWAYTSGLIFWTLATICLAFQGSAVADILFLAVGTGALVALVVWTITVYELKVEYVYSSEYYLEGFVVGVDRTLINLSSSLFLLAIPPERAENLRLPGNTFTFVAGFAFMVIGTIIVWTIPYKRRYLRQKYEEVGSEATDVDGITDVEIKDDFENIPLAEEGNDYNQDEMNGTVQEKPKVSI